MAKLTDVMLQHIMPHAPARVRAAALPLLNHTAFQYQINTRRRMSAWLANLAQETAELRWTEEIASGREYEGRADLGNTHPGDGPRFKGHGDIQITGLDAHQAYTDSLRKSGHLPFVDFIQNPRALGQPPYCIDSAGWFVNGYKHLNPKADAGDFLAYCVGVNGRNRKTHLPNGWAARQAYYRAALAVIPDGWTLDDTAPLLTVDHIAEAVAQSQDTDSGYPDYNPSDGSDLTASNGSEGQQTPGNASSQDGYSQETPSGAAPGASAEDKELSPQVVTKESPSIFSRVMTAIVGAIATAIAGITSTCGSDAISKAQDTATDKVTSLPGDQLMHLALVVVYIALGLGFALGLFYIASKIWEKATARSHELNMAKVVAAADQTSNTVEFKK